MRKALAVDELNTVITQLRTDLLGDKEDRDKTYLTYVTELNELKSIIKTQTAEIMYLKEIIEKQSLRSEQVESRLDKIESEISLPQRLPIERDNSSETAINTVSFAEVVRNTVKSALYDKAIPLHGTTNEVIVSNLKEDNNDSDVISNLCDKINFLSKPSRLQRIGKQVVDKHRLLKISFDTPFDARTFIARFNQEKSSTTNNIPNIRVRPSKSAEDRKVFNKSYQIASKMNQVAKNENANYSFSVRDNGEIWKFNKTENDKWIRASDWKLPENTGNG